MEIYTKSKDFFYKHILLHQLIPITIILIIFKYTQLSIIVLYQKLVFSQNSPSIILTLFEPLKSESILVKYLGIIGLFLSLFYFFFYKKISWKLSIENKNLKIFILILVIFLTWKYGFFEYNYYLGSFFLADRIILILMTILVFLSPIFIPIYLVLVTVIAAQINFPFGGYSLTDEKLFWEILILVSIFCFLKIYFKDLKAKHLLLLIIVIHASNYFYPGLKKIAISPNGYEWSMFMDLHHYFHSSHARGWLHFIDQEKLDIFAKFFSKFNSFGNFVSTLIQLSAILILLNKRVAIVMCVLFEVLHITVLLATGINFYKWILFNVALLWLISKKNIELDNYLFKNKNVKIISVILILLAPQFLKPVWLGWYMPKSINRFHFEIETASNKIYNLMPNDFAPYQKSFAFQRFHKILPKNIKILNKDIGATPLNSEVYKNLNVENEWEFRQILNSVGKENILNLIEQKGVNIYDENYNEMFDKFITDYFNNLNLYIKENGNRNRHFLLPISHIFARVRNNFNFEEEVSKLKISFTISYIDNDKSNILKTYDIKEYKFK